MKNKDQNFVIVENVALLIRALKHPFRIKILNLIIERKSISVNEILEALNSEASITSQNLKILKDVNLVNIEKQGKFIYYKPNLPLIENFAKQVNDFDLKTIAFRKSLRKPNNN
jgi:DNA-binding transcriptional ArsR family regulator